MSARSVLNIRAKEENNLLNSNWDSKPNSDQWKQPEDCTAQRSEISNSVNIVMSLLRVSKDKFVKNAATLVKPFQKEWINRLL